MKSFTISNVDSVYDFLYEVFTRNGDSFDPATDLHSLKNASGNLVFTPKEADELEKVMIQCFNFCVLNDLNIDTMAAMANCDMRSRKHVA